MEKFIHKWKNLAFLLLVSATTIVSCNKDLPVAEPIVTTPPTGSSIMTLLDAPTFSFLKAAVTRAGLTSALANANNRYTVFAPNDAAFIASGIPSIAVINSLPVATLTSILNYHIIGGQVLNSPQISEKYPNMYLQSSLMIAPPSAALPSGYRMPIGVSRRGANAWANNIPVTAANIGASNGVVHTVARVVAPPDSTLGAIIARDPSYSYLAAAVARADAGPPPGAPMLTPLINNALANFTIFAPTNDAFIALYTGLGLGAAGPITEASVNLLPSATVWGILGYHVQGVRSFAVNFPAGDNQINSLLGGPPTAPPQIFKVALPSVQVRGPGNVVPTPGGPVSYYANVVAADKHAINGVIHRIDAVLLPQ
jgi:uncharacterized surface protein with fasciclin (FAS1) repeats